MAPMVTILWTRFIVLIGMFSACCLTWALAPSQCRVCRHSMYNNNYGSTSILHQRFADSKAKDCTQQFRNKGWVLLASSQQEPQRNTNINNNSSTNNRGGTARFTGIQPPSSSSSATDATNTNILDYILSVLLSDIGSIVIGALGLMICLVNRLAIVGVPTDATDTSFAQAIGQQSRSDLLAVFSSIALLLNGVSKLDVTSALAETVVLDGIVLKNGVEYMQAGEMWLGGTVDKRIQHAKDRVQWALDSILASTPAKSAVIMVYNNKQDGVGVSSSSWVPGLLAGVVPSQEVLWEQIPDNIPSPILDRFLTQVSSSSSSARKESYLPTLQALPGKVEFTYLPWNTQAVLIVPVTTTITNSNDYPAVLVLGSDTAKSFTPRDVAWCQVLASRLESFRILKNA